jgi:hypothetical protein
MSVSLERLARNQTLFREVNERLLKLTEGTAGWLAFLCECSREGCSETISLSLDEYNAVRAHPTEFVVAPGHETPEIERLIDSNGHYAVVEKIKGVAFAIERDPRAASRPDNG